MPHAKNRAKQPFGNGVFGSISSIVRMTSKTIWITSITTRSSMTMSHDHAIGLGPVLDDLSKRVSIHPIGRVETKAGLWDIVMIENSEMVGSSAEPTLPVEYHMFLLFNLC